MYYAKKIAWRISEWLKMRLINRLGNGLVYRSCRSVYRGLWPLTNFRESAGDGIFYTVDELGMCSLLPLSIIDYILEKERPKTLLDVGCGTGRTLEYFLQKGVDALGVEGSRLAISRSRVSHKIVEWDLRKPLNLNRRFDLVYSYEVAEHLPLVSARTFVDSIQRHTDTVIMTAAKPGQGGAGHLNEQPPNYWIGLFSQATFALDLTMTTDMQKLPDMFAKNILVFRRG